MTACVVCGEPGVLDHSVTVAQARAERAASLDDLVGYTRCLSCAGEYRRTPSGVEWVESGTIARLGPTFWMAPPWLEPSTEADFELSWDLVAHYFAGLSQKLAAVRALPRMITELRALGYGPRLRAGQSLATLIWSRSVDHGLGPSHSHVDVAGHFDEIRVTGTIAGVALEARLVPASAHGWLGEVIARLAVQPLE